MGNCIESLVEIQVDDVYDSPHVNGAGYSVTDKVTI